MEKVPCVTAPNIYIQYFQVSGVLKSDVSEHLYFNFNVSRFLVYCMVTLLEVQLTRNAVVILDTAATKFFLRDFNLRTRSLWVSLYWNLVSSYFYKLSIDSFHCHATK